MRGIALAGASSRLLPASVPFRFFGGAVVCHMLAWIALLAGAAGAPRFAGGLGWPLAALHLVTLGVLVMSAIGASLQLLPVATRQPLRATGCAIAVWWLYTPGLAAIALGMGAVIPWLLAAGAVAVTGALILYAAVLARNLVGAKGMPVVVAHGWVALGSLVVVLSTALSLAFSYLGAPGLAHSTAIGLHVAFGTFGFMGLLAFGFSYILIPMFALATAPADRPALASLACAVAALLCAATAALGIAPVVMRCAAIALGAAAIGLHLRLMLAALRTGMRGALGRSFILVRLSWVMLAASLAVGLAMTLDIDVDGLPTLFGLLVIGWLLTFLLGVLQRIVPFLASMHTARGAQRTRTPSSLTDEGPLAMHFGCHLAALALLAAAVAADSAWLISLGAAAGLIGAVAFAWFFVVVLVRMSATEPPPATPHLPVA